MIDRRDSGQGTGELLIIGVGSPYRSDDAIGLWTADILARTPLPGVVVRKEERDGFKMMEAWNGSEDVIIIDAMSSGQSAGTIMEFDLNDIEPHKNSLRCSTHGFGLAEAISLSKTLGKIPCRMRIYGIEGKSFGFGTELTEDVQNAGRDVAATIVREITRLSAPVGVR